MVQRSLRQRLLFTFGLGSLGLSLLFASLAYLGVERLVVGNQERVDLRQAYVNAALVRTTLYTNPAALDNTLNSISRATTADVLVRAHGEWIANSSGARLSDAPAAVVRAAEGGGASYQVFNGARGHVELVVAVAIPAVESQVIEIFQLGTLQHTLEVLLLVLAAGALLTALIGLGSGLWITHRTVRPLEEVSGVAAAIAQGDLDTRLVVTRADREVQQLTESFNDMVDQLTERLERDARFAGDVSHELRSPLTTLATTSAVLQLHRHELSPAGQASLDLLVADLAIFQNLVEDLLEMARSDAGAVPTVIETVAGIELVRQCVRSAARRHGLSEPPLEVAVGVDQPLVDVDRRRFERVMTNLIENAARYAGGAVAVRVDVRGPLFLVDVDDAGPGIDPAERDRIFERFFRGDAANARGGARGTGLGLALVRDHLRAIGAAITVLTSPEGGARFEISLPVSEEQS